MRIHQAATTMFRIVVNYVAPLAERRQLRKCAVARVIVDVRAGGHTGAH